MFPVAARVTALLALLGFFGWAVALEVHDAAPAEGVSGEYVTLGFSLAGHGTYAYEVDVAAPWRPLASAGRVQVDGTGFVSVTLKVPRDAPAGVIETVTVTFVNVDDPADGGVGRGTVEALATAAVRLSAPSTLDGTVGEALELSLLVENRGNAEDAFFLSATSAAWHPRFETTELLLAPGEAREVRVVLEPQGSVNDGYQNLLIVTVTSRNDPSVSAKAYTRSTFRSAGVVEGAAGGNRAPRLTVSTGLGVGAGASFGPEGTDLRFGYGVVPALSGQLSDYTTVSAGVGRLAGDLVDPFSEIPSRFDAALTGDGWDARASLAPGAYGVGGGGTVGGWRLGGSGTYVPGEQGPSFGATGFAVSQLPGLDLQFSAATNASSSGRADSLAASYRTPISEGVVLGLGGSLSGFGKQGGYQVVAGFNESLGYQSQTFDVTQTYSAVPQSGFHAIGLTGGLRSAGAVGLRASTSLLISPASQTWRNAVSVSGRLAPGIGLGVTGTYQTSTADATWSVAPRLSISYGRRDLSFGLTVGYAYTGVVRGDVAPASSYSATANLGAGPFRVTSSAVYEYEQPAADSGAARFSVAVAAEYRPATATTITGRWSYESDTSKGSGGMEFGVVWKQRWSRYASTSLSYDKSFVGSLDGGVPSQHDRIALIGEFRDAGIEGLDLAAGYALTSSGGLFTGAPITHDLSLRAGYTLRFSFDTPDAVVGLFGGRKGGVVSGVAYVDRDLDGMLSAGDERLGGLEVMLGGARATTDETGAFSVRVRAGSYAWRFGAGLPADVQLLGEGVVRVEDDSTERVDLRLSPVATLEVHLFDDVDNDGVRGTDERGISFGRVIISGPAEEVVMVDARGNAVVSGLVPGTYTVAPDPAGLPPRYRPTTEPVDVVLRAGERLPPVSVGAAPPPREVVTTFSGAKLAVVARTAGTSVDPGGELAVFALVSGDPERVVARFGGQEVPLTNQGGRWVATVLIPEGMPGGAAELRVVAFRGDSSVESVVTVNVR